MSRTRIHRTLAAGGAAAAPTLAAINRALVRISQMIIDLPEIVDLDLDPVQADAQGLHVLGVMLRVAPVTGEEHRRLAIRPYPRDLEETVSLRDGRPVLLRPIRPEDEPAHVTFISRLTPQDIRFRFFGFVRRLEHVQMARMTQIDYDREMAFVAVTLDSDREPETLGIVQTITDPDNVVAEFSMVVRSDLKGLGLGGQLLGKMIRYGQSRGTREIMGQVLPDNRDMLRLTRRLGFTARMNTEEEVMDVRRTLT
jgi:acetyltransferase